MLESFEQLKQRRKRLNGLLSKICSNTYILDIQRDNKWVEINLSGQYNDGISLSACSGLFLTFQEKWELINGAYILTRYSYGIHYYKITDQNQNKSRLFGYDLHPGVQNIDFEHINIMHAAPFHEKIHYYNDLFNSTDARDTLFEKIVLSTIKKSLLSANIISEYEKYLVGAGS